MLFLILDASILDFSFYLHIFFQIFKYLSIPCTLYLKISPSRYMLHLMQCNFLFLLTRVNLHKNWPRNHTIKGGFLSTFSHHKISILNYKLSSKLLCIQGAQACKHEIIEGIPSIHQSCISVHRFSFFLLRRQRSWPSREDIYIQSSFFFSIQA